MTLILLEGMPGAGKSTILNALKKYPDITLMHEFLFKREVITKEYGIFKNNNVIECDNLKLKELEDKLEDFLLKSRFQDSLNEFEDLKIGIAKERIKEMEKFNGIVVRESFFGGLIDKCSEKFLKELTKLLTYVNIVFFITADDKTLEERQKKRVLERNGKYNDKTNKERNELFLKQFYEVTNRKVKIIYLNAKNSPEEIADKVIKSL